MTEVGQDYKSLDSKFCIFSTIPHSTFQKTGLTDMLATSSTSISSYHPALEDRSLLVEPITVIPIPAFRASLEPMGGHLAKFWPMRHKWKYGQK